MVSKMHGKALGERRVYPELLGTWCRCPREEGEPCGQTQSRWERLQARSSTQCWPHRSHSRVISVTCQSFDCYAVHLDPCHGAFVYEDLTQETDETPGFERLRDQVLARGGTPQNEKHPVCRTSPTSWTIRGSPRSLRRWRAIPAQGFGHWLLVCQLAHGSAALVLHDAEEEHVSVWLQRLVQSVRHLDVHPLAGRCDPHGPLPATTAPWRASDRQRVLAGSDLRFVGAMIMVKGDGAEFAVTFGFRPWPTTRTLLFSAMQVVGQTARGARQEASPCSPHHGTQRLSRCKTPLAEHAKATVIPKQPTNCKSSWATCTPVGVGSAEDKSRRQKFPLSVSPRICVESPPTCWSSFKVEESATSCSRRCSHHVVNTLR